MEIVYCCGLNIEIQATDSSMAICSEILSFADPRLKNTARIKLVNLTKGK
jgi:hypothetical protein